MLRSCEGAGWTPGIVLILRETFVHLLTCKMHGLGCMPNIEPSVEGLVLSPDEALRLDVRCPRPQYRLSDDLIIKSYETPCKFHVPSYTDTFTIVTVCTEFVRCFLADNCLNDQGAGQVLSSFYWSHSRGPCVIFLLFQVSCLDGSSASPGM